MVAGVVGYSRLVDANEVATPETVRSLRETVLEPLLTEHRGRVVNLMGDGLIARVRIGRGGGGLRCRPPNAIG
jgi:class 3 adenylate cyclase